MTVLRFYRKEGERGRSLQRASQLNSDIIILSEHCYNVELNTHDPLGPEQKNVLRWLFSPPLQAEQLQDEPFLQAGPGDKMVEIGPRLNFSTAWSTNTVSICQSVGLHQVNRVELSRRLLIKPKDGKAERMTEERMEKLIGSLYDSMTECVYAHPITSFAVETRPQEVFEVDILGEGRAALEKANDELVAEPHAQGKMGMMVT